MQGEQPPAAGEQPALGAAPVVPIGPALDESTPSSAFSWTIENLSGLTDKRILGPEGGFPIGGLKWRLLIFPKGNTHLDYFAAYLEVTETESISTWGRHATFTLSVANQLDPSRSFRKDASHVFTARESDWGFSQFMPLTELMNERNGFVVNDTLKIEAEVNVRKSEGPHDSKKETGCVGLKNQGATCYMNSLLQTLYHLPYFRKAVYHMPTADVDKPEVNIPLQLQALFFKLQFHTDAVATKDLTKSFGWDNMDAFMQHDIQELSRVLSEKLEEKMKGTSVEGTIQHLFEGSSQSFIQCKNIDFRSARTEPFQDIQLVVSGCTDVYASLDKYTEEETMDGPNQYMCEGHGLQDATKGLRFERFPPILQLQLKRFDYDYKRDLSVKFNDRYEFPTQLDLDREGGKYLAPTADRSVRNLYTLHSVLVHSGGVHGGHYYAYINPKLDGNWLKFDDDRVTKEEEANAVAAQYGGEEDFQPPAKPGFNAFKLTKYSNAYMLVYVRDSDKAKIACDVVEDDIAAHVKARMAKEAEDKAKRKKDKAEAHLYTVMRVSTDADLAAHVGVDTYFDLVDHDRVLSFPLLKQTPFSEFKEKMAADTGIPVHRQRYWTWVRRQNKTSRPAKYISPLEEANNTVQTLRDSQPRNFEDDTPIAELRLYLETPYRPEEELTTLTIRPVNQKPTPVLVFFKFYDPSAAALAPTPAPPGAPPTAEPPRPLRYVGRGFFPLQSRVGDLLPFMRSLVRLPPATPIDVYEEVKHDPNVLVDLLNVSFTLEQCEISDGDILCFQMPFHGGYPEPMAVSPLPGAGEPLPRYWPTVVDYLGYTKHRQLVHFKVLDKPREGDLLLELSKEMRLPDICAALARALGLEDPRKLRLTGQNAYSQMPKPSPYKSSAHDTLAEMLHGYTSSLTSDTLYYEVLDLPLAEVEMLKTLKIAWHNCRAEEVAVHVVRLPRESTVADVLDHMRTVASPAGEPPPRGPLRLLEVYYHKIYKTFDKDEKIELINDSYWVLRAEEVPEEELSLGPADRLPFVNHITRDTPTSMPTGFGEPFYFPVREHERVRDLRPRLAAKLGVPGEDVAAWKVAFVVSNRVDYLAEDDLVAHHFPAKRADSGYGTWETFLGLEHPNRGGHKKGAQRHGYNEKTNAPIKIWN